MGALAPAGASAFSSAVAYSDSGAFIGQGSDLTFDSRTATVQMNGDDRAVNLYFEDPASGSDRTFEFAPPAGEHLQEGRTYLGAQRYPFQDEARPGLDVNGDGRGCNKVRGAFRIEDLATSPDGKVTRLHALFEHHCGNVPPATFGEVRYGYPEPSAPTPIPTVLRWPAQERDAPPVARPVTVRGGTSPVALTSSAVAGAGAGSFAVTRDDCAGRTLAPAASCRVWVAYKPTAQGAAHAQLRVGRSSGGTVTVDLIGNAYGGTTDFTLDVPSDSEFGGGRDMAYTGANGIFFADGPKAYGSEAAPRHHYAIAINGADGQTFFARFHPPGTELVQVGRTYHVSQDTPAYEGGPYLELSAYASVCDAASGWFRFDELRLDADGEPTAIDVSFVDNCQWRKPITLTGRYRRQAGDSSPPPAWTAAGVTDPVIPQAPSPETGPSPAPAAATGPTIGTSAAPVAVPANLAAPATRHTDLALTLSPQERRTCQRYLGKLPKVTSGIDSRERIRGTRRRDAIAAGGGRDRVTAGDGGDCVAGGPGGDRVDGGDGRDVLMGGPGDDTVIGGPGKDVLLCGPGKDTVYAGPGDRYGDCERVVRVRR